MTVISEQVDRILDLGIGIGTGPSVDLVDFMGDDSSIVRAARVSVAGVNEVEFGDREKGLVNYLLREKHGSPFEHVTFTFYVKAPIFVFREFQRHRAGFSYNEMSGRYTKLEPDFYAPSPTRPLINVGTSAKPKMAPATTEVYEATVNTLIESYGRAWADYEKLLELGIAKEVARLVLPVGIYSQMYVTLNARSLMNFLSLRTHEPEARHVSHPQYEIEQVARLLEESFAELLPVTYAAYNENGRVSP